MMTNGLARVQAENGEVGDVNLNELCEINLTNMSN